MKVEVKSTGSLRETWNKKDWAEPSVSLAPVGPHRVMTVVSVIR